ncbi:MAG TPA: glycosyltransferase [Candidatus Sulfotelmatobacter sp.]|nr:glycosyltransferase [Candidatus Sulfotelmatobacter sp.]
MNVREPEAPAWPPRFSIIITFYNQRGFIKDAVDSALALRKAGLEIIAVDDASTDGSPEVLKQYQDSVQIVCLETNQGACAARNRGASLATGNYLVFLDGDDAFQPWALDVYERIIQAKKPKMILGTMGWFEGSLSAVPPGAAPQEITMVDYSDYLRRDRPFGNSASALIIARESFENVHGWQTDFFPLEDQDLALRLGVAGRTIQILGPPTVLHRAHGSYTVKNALACISAVDDLHRRERHGVYPGGAGRRFERRALIGGIAIHWTKRAAKSGMYGNAITLLARGWPMVLAAVSRRVGVLMSGRQPCETIKI